MVAPQQTSDSVRSMLNQYDQSGQLPKWALNNGETYVMVGDPADCDHRRRLRLRGPGLRHVPRPAGHAGRGEPAQQRPARRQLSTRPRATCRWTALRLLQLLRLGRRRSWSTTRPTTRSRVRGGTGRHADAASLAARANNWQNVFNPGSGLPAAQVRQRRSSQTGFTPDSPNGFVEADACQYTPMEPFDIAGLIAAAGGNASWIASWTACRPTSARTAPPANADFGNEPSIEIPWEYDYAGAPYKTQAAVRTIQQQIFTGRAGRHRRQRRPGHDERLVRVVGARLLPGDPGHGNVLALGSPVFPKCGGAPGRRQDADHRRHRWPRRTRRTCRA